MVTGKSAITFNAAGLSDATLKGYGVYGASQNNISAIIIRGEPLNSMQAMAHNIIGLGINQAAGNLHYKQSSVFTFNPVELHSIDTVLKSLYHLFEINLW